ncbi:hypothetical protein [Aurantiacibacter marinus]|uniref:Uncharacterized protein n=1 Tax=Aurantiacibacter marinus TaxID=874156 RepID=A0A0H0XNP0_9SPHN|nr:hypothetical protein [Aurantiacibacter marinus]KLI63562.1 hypothetical protein AAV99_07295 [Aurantiacibacter marinus]
MKSITKAFAKGTFATVAAGAMAVTAVSPAAAQDRYRDRHDDGISAGEVIAGAVILGGLAAILSSGNNDRYDDRDRRYRDRDYRGDNYRHNRRDNRGYANNGRRAVEACVRAAERTAQRYTGSSAEVYEIRDVDRERHGFEVKGRIAVRDNYRSRGHRGDYRRGYRNDGWDEGRFECEFRNGRVVDIDFRGIRGL